MAYTITDDEIKRRRELLESLQNQQRNYGTYQESDYVRGLKDSAMQTKNQLDNYGDFNFSRQADFDKIYGNYMNRPKFSWDADSDSLYQIYKDKYIRGGQMAMQDAMGQAAAMTGGYGNSYTATVGNQAYQNYLTGLNNVVPELYQLAMNRYKAEGDEMRDRLGLLQNERSNEYGLYTDKYGRLVDKYGRDYGLYGNERSAEQTAHDTAYNRLADSLAAAQTDYGNSVSIRQAADQLAASRAAASSRSSGGTTGNTGNDGSSGGSTKVVKYSNTDYNSIIEAINKEISEKNLTARQQITLLKSLVEDFKGSNIYERLKLYFNL